jgi:hypothetical protein
MRQPTLDARQCAAPGWQLCGLDENALTLEDVHYRLLLASYPNAAYSDGVGGGVVAAVLAHAPLHPLQGRVPLSVCDAESISPQQPDVHAFKHFNLYDERPGTWINFAARLVTTTRSGLALNAAATLCFWLAAIYLLRRTPGWLRRLRSTVYDDVYSGDRTLLDYKAAAQSWKARPCADCAAASLDGVGVAVHMRKCAHIAAVNAAKGHRCGNDACAGADVNDLALRRCRRCRRAHFCSSECAEAAAVAHQPVCDAAVERREKKQESKKVKAAEAMLKASAKAVKAFAKAEKRAAKAAKADARANAIDDAGEMISARPMFRAKRRLKARRVSDGDGDGDGDTKSKGEHTAAQLASLRGPGAGDGDDHDDDNGVTPLNTAVSTALNDDAAEMSEEL